jgi:hypothetical protein
VLILSIAASSGTVIAEWRARKISTINIRLASIMGLCCEREMYRT